MSIPDRIQRKRTKGWRSPAGTVCVSRPGRYGNPFRPYSSAIIRPVDVGVTVNVLDGTGATGTSLKIQCGNVEECLAWYRIYAEHSIRIFRDIGEDWLEDLREASWVACWCPLNRPCHADVLIELLHRKWKPN